MDLMNLNNFIENIKINTINIYRNELNAYKNTYKKIRIDIIIIPLELLWQLVYLIIIIGYNLWYIPSHTSSETTLEEARRLVLNYLPILCCFNVFWVYFVVGLIISFGGLNYGCVSFCKVCFCKPCLDIREKHRNKIISGDTNIKLYSIDVNDSLKKSNIV
jgi:hypothetical protein